jgi:hypothetical protein
MRLAKLGEGPHLIMQIATVVMMMERGEVC